MADVKNMITLGIGAAPGAISWHVLTGLSPDKNAAPGERSYSIDQELRAYSVKSESRLYDIEQESRVLAVRE